MEIVGEQQSELPFFDGELARLCYPAPDGEVETQQAVDVTAGTLELAEQKTETGSRRIEVIHREGGERQAQYRFEVIDAEYRLCQYAADGYPPWSVIGALNEYGYHDHSTPSSGRQYVLDSLLDTVSVYSAYTTEHSGDPLSGFLVRSLPSLFLIFNLFAIESQVETEQVESVLKQLHQSSEALEIDSFYPESLADVLQEYGIDRSYHPLAGFSSGRGVIGSRKVVRDGSDHEAGKQGQGSYGVAHYEEQVGANEGFYVALIGSDAVDRFSFHITDHEAKECTAQINRMNDFPPRLVREHIRSEHGYEISNVPKLADPEADTHLEILVSIDEMIRRSVEVYEPESTVFQNVYHGYLSEMSKLMTVAYGYDTLPDRFPRIIEEILSQLDLPSQGSTVAQLSLKSYTQIIEKAVVVAEQLTDMTEPIEELYEQRRFDQRGAALETGEVGLTSEAAELYRTPW